MEITLKNVKKKDLPIFESLAKSLGFEITKKEEKLYNPEFVKKILEGEKDIEEGKGITMTMEELHDLCK